MIDAHVQKEYSPVGRCIYCENIGDLPLGDEHIVPYALDGNCVLPAASCKSCERITHKFEHTCGRLIFGQFRLSQGMRTRHKKERPTHLPVHVEYGNGDKAVENVPIAEHHGTLLLFKFGEPTVLSGLPPDLDMLMSQLWVHSPKMNEVALQRGWREIDKVAAFHPLSFARMLAKAAHAFTTAELGHGAFKPLLIDLIHGRTEVVSYLVGGKYEDEPPSQSKHELALSRRLVQRRQLIVVRIRLFATIGAPIYYIVSGELNAR